MLVLLRDYPNLLFATSYFNGRQVSNLALLIHHLQEGQEAFFYEIARILRFETSHEIDATAIEFALERGERWMVESLGLADAAEFIRNPAEWQPDRQAIYKIDGVGKFRFERSIGQGAFGNVFSATTLDGERRAIKVLYNSNDQEPEVYARIAENGRHPNIVHFHGSRKLFGKRRIVMNLVEGKCLGKRELTRQQYQEMEDALAWLGTIGVVYEMENMGENILISEEGTVILIDFGCNETQDGGARLIGS